MVFLPKKEAILLAWELDVKGVGIRCICWFCHRIIYGKTGRANIHYARVMNVTHSPYGQAMSKSSRATHARLSDGTIYNVTAFSSLAVFHNATACTTFCATISTNVASSIFFNNQFSSGI